MQLLAPGGGAKHHMHCEFWPTSRPFQESFPSRHTHTRSQASHICFHQSACFTPPPRCLLNYRHRIFHLRLSFLLLYHLPSAFTLTCFTVPAHGPGSLSNDEGGVSGAVHGLAGERDWMLGTWLVRWDDGGGIRAVRWTRTQALQQGKPAAAQTNGK